MTAPQDPFSTPPGDTPAGGSGAPVDQPAGYGTPGGQPAGPPAGYGAPAGQPAYGQQPFGAPGGFGGNARPRNGSGVAALVLGILSLFSWFLFIGGVFGLIAVILGVSGRKRAKRGEADNGGMALAGIITGAIGLLLTVLAVVGVAAVFNSDEGRTLIDCLADAQTPAEQQQCQTELSDSAG